MKCPKCRYENPEEMNFCGKCGTSLQPSAPCMEPQTDALSPRLSREPERKQVTALFSDLTGYTSITEKLDPEQVKEITSHIFTGVKEIIAKYEGFIERVMGDGCLAFFGIPRAHEDDPVRAIHAALEIHDMVKQLSPQYESRVGALLTMHSGINTGLVVTADVDPEKGTHGVAGDAVNVASRLSGMAGPGEIFVGEETVRRAKGRFVFDDLGQKQAKCKAEPVRVFKVISGKSPQKASSIDRQVSSEMVGRDKELDRLEFQVMKAINGEGSVVNVIGEAGIGKSRLIAELKKRDVMKRVTLLEGRAISIGKNLSFHPITDLFKQWAMIGEGNSEAAAFDKLEKAIRQVHPGETNEILPFLATLMGMKLIGKHAERIKGIEGEALEKLIFKNVRELVIKGAELRPTVVVMEDLHWADTSSIEMLEALYRLAEKHRIAFINVFRPGYFDSDDGKIGKAGQLLPVPFAEIEIQPLDSDNAESLIDNMLAIKGLPYTVKHQIVERAGGNPFFIEEVVRSLIDEGAVVKRNGGFEVTDKIDRVVIPPTINDVLMARIDRLEERTRELVKVASVIGRSFFDRIIKDVADSIEDVDQRLAYLKDVQLIRDRVRMQELEYLFKHALAQEAAYESTLLLQRKALHLKVAQSIEKTFQERLHEFYGMLAYHYSRGEDPAKAEEYMTRAGEEALRSSASSEALNYFREALKLYVDRYGDEADVEKLTAFKKNLAIAHFNRGQFADSLLYLDEVLETRGYRPPRGKFALGLRAVGDFFVITTVLYSTMVRKKRIPDKRELENLDLRYTKCWCLLPIDNQRMLMESFSIVRIALSLDLNEIPQGPIWASVLAIPFIHLSLFSISARLLAVGGRGAGDRNRRGALELAMTRTFLALSAGEWESEPDLDSSLVDLGLKTGNLHTLVLHIRLAVHLMVEKGLFGDAKTYSRKAQWIAETYSYDFGLVVWYQLTVATGTRTGELLQALSQAEKGISLSDQAVLGPFKLSFMGFSAIASILLGQTEVAAKTIREGERFLSGLGKVVPMFFTPFSLGRVLTHLQLLQDTVQSGSKAEIPHQQKTSFRFAREAVRASRKYAPYRTWILRLMGDYYWLVGKQRKAMRWYDRSIKEGEKLGARPDLSRTYFEVGKRLLEPQSKYKQLNGIDAEGYLEKAERLFREMGLDHDLDELERVRQGM
jgi:class 3 adenylate cyclase/tetratricopeptide (TPR) repeat protein